MKMPEAPATRISWRVCGYRVTDFYRFEIEHQSERAARLEEKHLLDNGFDTIVYRVEHRKIEGDLTMTDLIDLSTRASIEADNFRDMLEDGMYTGIRDCRGETWAVFSHGDECRVQAIVDMADRFRRCVRIEGSKSTY